MKRKNRWLLVASAVALLAFSVAAGGPEVVANTSRGGDHDQSRRCSVRPSTALMRLSNWDGLVRARAACRFGSRLRPPQRQGPHQRSTTFSLDGAINSHDLVGTYTVDSDTCTGEADTTIGTFHFVIADNGKQTRIIATSPGTTLNGTGIKQ